MKSTLHTEAAARRTGRRCGGGRRGGGGGGGGALCRRAFRVALGADTRHCSDGHGGDGGARDQAFVVCGRDGRGKGGHGDTLKVHTQQGQRAQL